MNEKFSPTGAINQPEMTPKKNPPAWEFPESPLFIDWYCRQLELPEEERSEEYSEFLEAEKNGRATPPTDEQIANWRIAKVREKNQES